METIINQNSHRTGIKTETGQPRPRPGACRSRLWLRLVAVVAALATFTAVTGQAFETGADMSELAREEQLGAVFCNLSGSPLDAMQEAENEHWTCCRLRLWVNPSGSDIFVNNLAYTIALAKRIKAHGMKWILDIHYSDTWADPGHQTTPSAWAGQSYAQLLATVQSYTANVLSTCKADGVLPDYVQIGNEIDGGLLWPVGSTANYSQFIGLIKAGIAGVRQISATPKIIIHISNGGNTSHVTSWFDTFKNQGVSYDIIGLSYYPPNGTDLSDIQTTINTINTRYGKQFMIMEFSYPWEDGISSGSGYWNTTAGQQSIIWNLCEKMRAASNGAGVMYWGATYVWNPNLANNWASEALWNGGWTWTTSLPGQASLWAQ